VLYCPPAPVFLRPGNLFFSKRENEKLMENEFNVHFKKEGNTWCANLERNQASQNTAGFGTTPEEALRDLFLEKDKDNYQKQVKGDKK
jgi:hypothetical protein